MKLLGGVKSVAPFGRTTTRLRLFTFMLTEGLRSSSEPNGVVEPAVMLRMLLR